MNSKHLVVKLCRPQDWIVNKNQSRRRYGGKPSKMEYIGQGYNWHEVYAPDTNPYSHVTWGHWYGHIHYLTDHAPYAVRQRWEQARKRLWQRMKWQKAGINDKI